MGLLHLACAKLSVPLLQHQQQKKIKNMATYDKWLKKKGGKSWAYWLFPQRLGFWKGRVWHCSQWAHHIKWCFLAASRWTGEHLGGLAVDIGMFSHEFLFWGVWKVSLSLNIGCLRLTRLFFRGFAQSKLPRFTDPSGNRTVATWVWSRALKCSHFYASNWKSIHNFQRFDCYSDLFLQKSSMTHKQVLNFSAQPYQTEQF